MAARPTPVLRALVLSMLLVGACYRPDLADCTVTCEAATDCADGQACRDGYCTATDAACSGFAGDAGTMPVRPDARPDLCSQGCTNGTCEAGVCVIDCTAEGACPDEVTCAPNLPCRIECGRNACSAKLHCGLASSCEIACTGEYACKDEVICGDGPCAVTCSGAFACEKKTKCQDACACDVRCTGSSSCKELHDCSADTCRLGSGCSSELPGCNTCS